MASTFHSAVAKGKNAVDAVFPPEKRSDTKAKLQTFAQENPILAAFLICNIAFTGLPVLVFATFILTILIFSLVTTLLLTGFAALVCTIFMAGFALLILLPTIFFTTMAASFMFTFGLGVYFLFRWLKDPQTAPSADSIRGKLNGLNGGTTEKEVVREKAELLRGEGRELTKQ